MAKRKPDDPPKGSPAWMSTFSDLMNLLLCFFVMLFSMSTISTQKLEMLVASMNQTISIFSGGAMAIGDGMLISNGMSQLNQLDDYINSTGKEAEGEEMPENLENAIEALDQAKLEESEEIAEKVEEALEEAQLEKEVDIEITSQYVQLTLNGALLFDSGSVELKHESEPLLNQIAIILKRYAPSTIEIEGHTDNVPLRGGIKYSNNDELSSGRAMSVFNFFRDNSDINMSVVKHSGRGEYQPVADNTTPEGRALNRRVEIRIYNSLSGY